MKDPIKDHAYPQRSCQEWEEILALTSEEQLSSEDYQALEVHCTSCTTCAILLEDYRLITNYTRRALSVAPLPELPASVLYEIQRVASTPGKSTSFLQVLQPHTEPKTLRRERRRTGASPLLSRSWAVILALVAVLLLCFAWTLVVQAPAQTQAASLSLQGSLKQHRAGATSVHTVSWSPDGKFIAVLWDDSTIQVLDANNHYQEILSQPVGWGHGLAWSPDSQYLASIGREDNTIQIWSIATHQCKTTPQQQCMNYRGHTAQVEVIAWSPDGKFIASSSEDQTVQIWDVHTMRCLYTYRTPGIQVTALAWSPDGKRIATGDNQNQVQVWDAFTAGHLMTYVGHKGPLTFVGWSPDDTSLLSSGYDGELRIWNVSTGSSKLIGLGDAVFAAAAWWGKTGNHGYLALVVGSTVNIWFLTDQQGELSLYRLPATYPPKGQEARDNIFSISWSPQGGQLIAGGSGNVLDFHLGE